MSLLDIVSTVDIDQKSQIFYIKLKFFNVHIFKIFQIKHKIFQGSQIVFVSKV